MAGIVDSLDSVLSSVGTTDGKLSVNLTDTQSAWIVDNLATFLENSDPKSTIRTNFLTKVIIPSAIKVYLPYTLIGIGSLIALGYFIGSENKK
jgi:hypothetical protein